MARERINKQNYILYIMETLFALMIAPDKKLSSEIRRLSKKISIKYGIAAAPKYGKLPPHISLFFKNGRMNDMKIASEMGRLSKDFYAVMPFKVKIDGFGYFKEAKGYVGSAVYLKVNRSSSLDRVYRIANPDAPEEGQKVMPHISIVKGIERGKFLRLRKDQRNYKFRRSFIAEGVLVGIQKNSGPWKFTILPFGK